MVIQGFCELRTNDFLTKGSAKKVYSNSNLQELGNRLGTAPPGIIFQCTVRRMRYEKS